MRKLNITIILALMLGMVFISSNSISMVKAADEVTIVFWYTENDAEKPGVLALIDDFEAANPGINVDAQQIGFFDCHDLYVSAYIAGEEPDVCRSVRDWVFEWAQSDMLEPLTDNWTAADKADYLPIAQELITIEDIDGVEQIWGFPQLVDTPAFMYNKEYFRLAGLGEPGLNESWTWDEYVSACESLETLAETHANLTYATTVAGLNYGFEPFYYGHGGQYFKNNIVSIANININSTETEAALEFFKTNVTEASYTPDWTLQGWETVNSYFTNGTVAFISQGPWELKNFLEDSATSIFKANNSNLGIMQLPHDEDDNSGSPVGMHSYTVSKYSEHKVEAIALARFMGSFTAQKEGAIDYYHSASRMSVMENPDVMAADTYVWAMGYYTAVAEVGVEIPKSMFWGKLDGDFATEINKYLVGDSNLTKCIDDTINVWSSYIDSQADIIREQNVRESTGIPGYSFIGLMSILAVSALLLKKRK